MAGGPILRTAVLLAVMVAPMPSGKAEDRLREASNPACRAPEAKAGIRTDRLSPKQLRVWKAIERIVFAKDASGCLTHPKLHGLWQWIEASRHVVHVELPDPKARCDHQAGKFALENHDPDGRRHQAVLRLCLPVIDGAPVRKGIRGNDGFIRFEGLGKEERYAEILGHELAHAVWVLSDQSHARLIEALDREVGEFNNLRRRAGHDVAWEEQMRQLLKRIELLTAEFEKPADIAEAEIWKELLASGGRH